MIVLVLGLVVAACGDDDSSGAGDDDCVIRFTFAPDPAWDWIVDEGILEEMEAESECRIIQSLTWDEFGMFAGGHADIVSVGSYETPLFESELDIDTVTFAKFNLARDIVVVPGDTDWQTLDDIPPGCLVGVEAFEGGPTVWAAIASDMHGRELGEDSGDLRMAIADFSVIPDLVVEGDFCAGISAPATASPYFVEGSLRALYDTRGASQLYAENYVPGHAGMASNNFIALKSWYDDNPEEIAFFMKVWGRAMDEFEANRNTIIASYPQHFGVEEGSAEMAWLIDYMDNTFNWFVDSPYLTEEWIRNEAEVTEILRRAGLIRDDLDQPIHVCIDPTSGDETCRLP
jgi:hypothetical protein